MNIHIWYKFDTSFTIWGLEKNSYIVYIPFVYSSMVCLKSEESQFSPKVWTKLRPGQN